MKHYLLNHQPQKELQAACAEQGQAPTCNARGKGRTPASPKTLTRILLVLLTMLLLPSAAWGQTVTVTKTITFKKEFDAVSGDDIKNSTFPVTVKEVIGSTTYNYNSSVKIYDGEGLINQYNYDSQKEAVVFQMKDNAVIDNYFSIILPGNYPDTPNRIELTAGYENAVDDEENGIFAKIQVIDIEDNDKIYIGGSATLLETTLTFVENGDKNKGHDGQTNRDRPGDENIFVYLNGNSDSPTTFTIKQIVITYETNDYGLTVAGIPVTGVNANDILGDGKVSFTPAGTNSATLTLSNANLEITTEGGAAIESSLDNLVVNLVGENTITSTATTSYAFKGNGSNNTITFQTDVQKPGKIHGEIPKANVFNNNITPSYQGLDLAGDNQGFTIGVIEYGLTIDETAVTSLNAENILGDNKVSFKPADESTSTLATLTLNSARISNIVSSLEGDLNILISGENQLNTISSTNANAGKLHITTTDNPSNPTFLSLIAPNDETSVINGFTDFTTTLTAYSVNNGSPESPITVTYDTNVLKSGNAIANAVAFLLSYDLTVAGVAVTSLNAGNILDGDNDGKVSFSPATLQDQTTIPATLTLTGATIDGGILWNSGGDLSIELSGKNSIIASGAVFKANVEVPCNLHIKKINDATSATLKYSGTIDKFTLSPTSDFKTQFGITDNSITYNYLTTEDVYNLEVAGIQVHNIEGELGYKGNILQNSETPTVTFDGSQTLTLNNAEIYSFSSTHAIETGLSTLNIDLKGNNSITTEGGYALYGATSSGSYTIIFTSSSDPVGNLTLKRSSGTLANYVTIDYDTNTGLVPTIITPSDASDLAAAKEAIIAKGTAMGITVAGVVVTNSNYTDIKGDGITGTKVSFTPANEGNETPAILTLNNASITGNVKFNDDLTVHLVGDNTITKPEDASGFYAFDLAASYNDLNLSTDETNPGTLKFVGLGSDSQAGSQRDYIIYSTYGHKNFTSDTTGDPTWKETYSTDATPSYFILSLNKHYNLWKNGHQYHDLILDNNDGFVFDPDPENPTLTITTSSSSDYINSGLEDLTIIVSGSQSLSHIAFGAPADTQAEGITTGTLTIKKNETSTATVNELTLANADGGVISGFSSVTIEEPMGVKSPSPFTTWEGTHNAIISDAQFYDLWVGGVQVTSGNASNIIGDQSSQPTAVFNAETSTLTLNGLQIFNSTSSPSFIESGLENLTVILSGENKFMKGGDVTTCYGFKALEGNTRNITFTAGESFSFIAQAEPEYAISGFNKVTYKDDLVAYMSEGNFYISEDIYLNFNTVYDNDYPTGVRIITSGLNADIVSHKIAYTIDYAKEDMEDVPETEYTGVIPLATITAGPCTVTAYTLSLDGENTKSNNIKGCYFQYTESEVIIGNGSTIDLMDYLLPALAGEEEVSFDNTSSQSGTIISISEEDNTITGIAYGTASVISTVVGEFTTFNQILEPDEFTLSISITVQDIIGESTFTSGQSYGTFYNTDQAYKVPEGVLKAYIIKSVDEEKGEIVTEETSVLPPSTPVLLFRTSTSGSANYVFTKVSGVEPANTELKYTTTEKEAVETSKLYVLYNGQFVKVTANTMIPANHCYLDLATTAGTRGFYNIGGGEGTTSLREVKSEGVNSEKWTDGEWYTLQGQRVAKPAKGLYILNGKKVVVK